MSVQKYLMVDRSVFLKNVLIQVHGCGREGNIYKCSIVQPYYVSRTACASLKPGFNYTLSHLAVCCQIKSCATVCFFEVDTLPRMPGHVSFWGTEGGHQVVEPVVEQTEYREHAHRPPCRWSL